MLRRAAFCRRRIFPLKFSHPNGSVQAALDEPPAMPRAIPFALAAPTAVMLYGVQKSTTVFYTDLNIV
jgi:hypothetical protein